jgi:hypothetical protein
LAVTFVTPFQVEWEVEAVMLLELALTLVVMQGVG